MLSRVFVRRLHQHPSIVCGVTLLRRSQPTPLHLSFKHRSYVSQSGGLAPQSEAIPQISFTDAEIGAVLESRMGPRVRAMWEAKGAGRDSKWLLGLDPSVKEDVEQAREIFGSDAEKALFFVALNMERSQRLAAERALVEAKRTRRTHGNEELKSVQSIVGNWDMLRLALGDGAVVDRLNTDAHENMRKQLGPFFKPGAIPRDPRDPSGLNKLGLLFAPRIPGGGRALERLNELISESSTTRRVFPLFGVTGAGKTKTIVDLAERHFVMYFQTYVPMFTDSATPGELEDLSFKTMISDLDAVNLTTRRCVVAAFVLSRLTVLDQILRDFKNVTPQQYIHAQFGELNRVHHEVFTEYMVNYVPYQQHPWWWDERILETKDSINKSLTHRGGRRAVFAWDEAQAAFDIAPGLFKSVTGKKQPLFYGLVEQLVSTRLDVVLSGTSLRLGERKSSQFSLSSGLKTQHIFDVVDFAPFSREEAAAHQRALLDMSGVEHNVGMFEGRARAHINVIETLCEVIGDADWQGRGKQELWDEAVERFKVQIDGMVDHMLEPLLTSHPNDPRAHRRNVSQQRDSLMQLCAQFRKSGQIGRLPMIQAGVPELVERGICFLRRDPKATGPTDDDCAELAEPWMAECIQRVFEREEFISKAAVMRDPKRKVPKLFQGGWGIV